MPNTISAIRRTKKTKLQTLVNKARKSKYKSAIKQMSAYLNAGNIDEAKKPIRSEIHYFHKHKNY